jgi:hypothetical protein
MGTDLKDVMSGVWNKTYPGERKIYRWKKIFECLRKTLKGMESKYRRGI